MIKKIVLLVIVLALSLELLSYLTLTLYIDDVEISFKEKKMNTFDTGDSGQVFSPYYGFDNRGKRNPPYDYQKEDGEYVVAVLGGSVAYYLGMIYNDSFKQLVKEKNPETKKVTLIPLALGGFKQPQQLFLFQFSLLAGAQYDLVLLIDGYNECVYVENNKRRNINPIYPSVAHYEYITKQFYHDFDIEDARYMMERQKYKEKLAQFSPGVQSKSNFMRLLSVQMSSYYIGKLHLLEKAYIDSLVETEMPINHSGNLLMNPIPDTSTFHYSARLWAHASRMVGAICKDKDIPFFHFLQPNQYVKDSKPLSEEEKKYYYTPEFFEAQCIANGYSYFIREGDSLRKEVPFYNLTNIFENTHETVYTDNCCHFYELGNEIMSRAIVDSISHYAIRENKKIF